MRWSHSKPVVLIVVALIAVLLFGAATIARPHDHASGVCQVCHSGHVFTLDAHLPSLADPLYVLALRRPLDRLVARLDGLSSDHASRAPPA